MQPGTKIVRMNYIGRPNRDGIAKSALSHPRIPEFSVEGR